MHAGPGPENWGAGYIIVGRGSGEEGAGRAYSMELRCASPQKLGAGEFLGMEIEGEFPLQDRKATRERWPECVSANGKSAKVCLGQRLQPFFLQESD